MGAVRKALNWYAKISRAGGRFIPPYKHVVQIGDPALRKVSEPVPLEKIKSAETQSIIEKLKFVLDKYEAVGMSAPQIGVNLRIFVIKYTMKHLHTVPNEIRNLRQMSYIPFTVFINPKLKVIDYEKVIFPEACESVKMYSADVARYKEVEVTGYNANGESISETYKGWPARIVQHEMDHLDGKMYTDIMDRKTLTCTCWEEVNLSRGDIAVPFNP